MPARCTRWSAEWLRDAPFIGLKARRIPRRAKSQLRICQSDGFETHSRGKLRTPGGRYSDRRHRDVPNRLRYALTLGDITGSAGLGGLDRIDEVGQGLIDAAVHDHAHLASIGDRRDVYDPNGAAQALRIGHDIGQCVG